MNVSKKKPRKLENLKVDEVSLVDNPANEIRFSVLKNAQAAAEVVESETGEEVALADVLALAKDGMTNLSALLSKRIAGKVKKFAEAAKDKPEAQIKKGFKLSELVESIDESEELGALLEATEKVFGPLPYDFPFRRHPVCEKAGEEPEEMAPAGECTHCPMHCPPEKADGKACKNCPVHCKEGKKGYQFPRPTKTREAIQRALATAGLPDSAKAALEEAVKELEAPAEREKSFVTKTEFADLSKKFDDFVQAATAAIQSMKSPK